MNVLARQPYAPLDLKSVSIARVYEWLTNRSAHGIALRDGSTLVRCPAADHEDVHPSAKLSPAKGLWICFACEGGGNILDMILANSAHRPFLRAGSTERVAAIRWLRRQLGTDHADRLEPQPIATPAPRRRIALENERVIAEYIYSDELGTATMKIVRIEGRGRDGLRDKRFEAAYRATPPGWRLGTKDTPLFPYRLPELVAAARAHRVILFPEGEQDAETLAEYAFVATSSPFGASFRVPAGWREYFVGAHSLLIIADADQHGRREAAKRLRILDGAAKETLVLDLFPQRSDGFDVTDLNCELVSAGHNAQARRAIFAELIRDAIVRARHPEATS